MYDFERCRRCVNIGGAWFGKTFNEITKRVMDKLGFKKEYDKAEGNQAILDSGGQIPWDFESGLDAMKRAGARTEVVFWFLGSQEFHKMFKFEPKRLMLKLSTWFDEYGNTCKGIFLKPNADQCPDTFKRVVFYYDKSFRVADSHVNPRKRLRENQAQEAFDHMIHDEIKTRPKEHLHFFLGGCAGMHEGTLEKYRVSHDYDFMMGIELRSLELRRSGHQRCRSLLPN
jgi:hypothetical protein